MTNTLEPEQPENELRPELQINISQEGLELAKNSFDRWNDSLTEIVNSVVSTALSTPPTVTDHTVEGLTRAMLMAYPTAEAWAEANRRQIVLGLLMALGVETKG